MNREPEVKTEDDLLKWKEWAERELSSLRAALATKQKALYDAEAANKKITEDIAAYERVIKSRTTAAFYPVGTQVFIGPQHKQTGTITRVAIHQDGQVFYLVSWWVGNEPRKHWLPANEVTDDAPLGDGQ